VLVTAWATGISSNVGKSALTFFRMARSIFQTMAA
jgi:hypothetical protein